MFSASIPGAVGEFVISKVISNGLQAAINTVVQPTQLALDGATYMVTYLGTVLIVSTIKLAASGTWYLAQCTGSGVYYLAQKTTTGGYQFFRAPQNLKSEEWDLADAPLAIKSTNQTEPTENTTSPQAVMP
ncbi:MAG: hypothetical protein A3I77_02155 [Gammaproteobacteria bacterium RIFCSPLOWO2_02_FULL_42_14]|nr:MAG: hypothetical protein A3B71_00855 [Gammaproteobacteria bacterium RIFCSPHIGHO2_02_FULL_42_43]OGT52157.1 MAG: hypothetical protein A3E54_06990 [Gammaproteobacteria bacterium RIFCSPHIGHO2_12_FULL_41_25]OGT62595.1 MAG: hypothetical protein A3I77_02155 [Gammaproteobacteria bacterium RIFCSPLOWO2_02_FULL_42_14]OGT86577.1 MAG: hypothetical protein A3G86_08675 [Gammaproteobacteria bacterium RIFCSPLOWO2_12_FULL_42_18]